MRFIVISKKDCPYCIEAKALLNKYGQQFDIYNLDETPILRAFVKDLGYNTVPQVWFKMFENTRAIHIGGYEEIKDYLSEKFDPAD